MQLDMWQDYFPYEPRPLQKTMLGFIEQMFAKKFHLVIEAANGTGKTITALAAALPYARQHDKKIVYLARTHSQMDRVIQELQQISMMPEIRVSGVALRGRGNMCLNTLVNKYASNNQAVGEMCAQLKKVKRCDYWNNMDKPVKVNSVLAEIRKRPVTAEVILDMAKDHAICPAETAKLSLSLVDVVACSYLYLFDPDIRPSFLESINAELEDLVVIIDECHNLPSSVNNITSDEVSTFTFNRAIREAKNSNRPDFVKFLEACSAQLLEETATSKFNKEKSVDPGDFIDSIYHRLTGVYTDDQFFEEMVSTGLKIRTGLAKQGKEPRSSLGRVGEFFFRWYDSIGKISFTHSLEKQKFANSRDSFVTLRLSSLDSSIAILPVLEEVDVSLSISGSIGDPKAYNMLTGIDKLKSLSNILPSPYQHSNIASLVVGGLSTKYSKRSDAMWKKMVHAIAAVANNTPANVGLFAPSYQILQNIMDAQLERYVAKEVVYVESGLSSEENDKLVSQFKRMAEHEGGLLVSVLGGRSSEGADFPGELMQSVIVVGIPYAPVNVRVDAEIKYLDDKFPGRGWDLAYQLPAINRASQAAGRPVRSLSDRAFILLADERFAWNKVQNQLPGWLRDSIDEIPYDPIKIQQRVKTFFGS